MVVGNDRHSEESAKFLQHGCGSTYEAASSSGGWDNDLVPYGTDLLWTQGNRLYCSKLC